MGKEQKPNRHCSALPFFSIHMCVLLFSSNILAMRFLPFLLSLGPSCSHVSDGLMMDGDPSSKNCIVCSQFVIHLLFQVTNYGTKRVYK
jgi:hypothetical protein